MRMLLWGALLLTKSLTLAQISYNYSDIACTSQRPSDVQYCNTDEGTQNPLCTCGSCDQVRPYAPRRFLAHRHLRWIL